MHEPATLALLNLFHRFLFFTTNSGNGGLQSTPVSGQENRDRQVWVEVVRKRQTCVIAPFGARGRVWERYCRVMRDCYA